MTDPALIERAAEAIAREVYDLGLSLLPPHIAKRSRTAARAAISVLPSSEEAVRAEREALEESVKLQSHYAALLNQYDGGNRRGFASARAWIDRLAECRARATKGPRP